MPEAARGLGRRVGSRLREVGGCKGREGRSPWKREKRWRQPRGPRRGGGAGQIWPPSRQNEGRYASCRVINGTHWGNFSFRVKVFSDTIFKMSLCKTCYFLESIVVNLKNVSGYQMCMEMEAALSEKEKCCPGIILLGSLS